MAGDSTPAPAAVDPRAAIPAVVGNLAVARAEGIRSDPTIHCTQETRIRNTTEGTIPGRALMAGIRAPARVAEATVGHRDADIVVVHRVAARPTSGMLAICVAP